MADTKGTDWMYNQNTEISKEEYLLGKAIGKNFEAEGTMGQINAVEYDCAPPSIFASQAAHQVDLQRKLIEDPLVAIKKRELEDRRKILDNPVKMKALQEHIEDLKRQRKSKKKKKKNKKSKGNDSDSDTDLDLKLLKKIKKMEEGEGDDSDDSNSDESREPSLERKVSKYVTYNPRDSRIKSPSLRSSRTLDRRGHNYKNSRKSPTYRRRSSSSPNHRKRSPSLSYRRNTSRSPSHRNRRSTSRSYRRKKSPSHSHRRRRSPSPRRVRNYDRSRSRSNEKSFTKYSRDRYSDRVVNISPRRKSDNSRVEVRRVNHSSRSHSRSQSPSPPKKKAGLDIGKNYRKRSPIASKSKTIDKPTVKVEKKTALTDAEKKAKLAEMVSNAAWRDDQRTMRVKKYREGQEKEELESRKDHDTNFINREMKRAQDNLTVESRITANKYNLQRGHGDMDKNFARR